MSDSKAEAMGDALEDLRTVLPRAQFTLAYDGVGAVRAATETIIQQGRALDQLPKIIEIAKEAGWDGVTNSKILSVFLDDELKRRSEALELLRQTQVVLRELHASAEMHETPSPNDMLEAQNVLTDCARLLGNSVVDRTLTTEERINQRLQGLSQEISAMGNSLVCNRKRPGP